MFRGLLELPVLDVRRQSEGLSHLRVRFKILLDAVGVECDAEPRQLARRRKDLGAHLVVRRLDVAKLPDDDADGQDDAEHRGNDGVGDFPFVAFDSVNRS